MDKSDFDIVKNLDEVYPVGTFVQIHEMQDMGDRLRMIVLAHRRIRTTGVIQDVPEQESDVFVRRGRLIKTKKKKAVLQDGVPETIAAEPLTEAAAPPSEEVKNQVLMVEVENIPVPQFQMTDHIKALTAEIVKTIRDIISMNPLYRESLMQMIHSGQRITDNPIYLADLGAALTAAEAGELQVGSLHTFLLFS